MSGRPVYKRRNDGVPQTGLCCFMRWALHAHIVSQLLRAGLNGDPVKQALYSDNSDGSDTLVPRVRAAACVVGVSK